MSRYSSSYPRPGVSCKLIHDLLDVNLSDELSGPMGVRSVLLPNNLTSVMLEWDIFSQSVCSRDTVSYTIAIDGVAVPPDNITVLSNTSYIVSGLEANRMYTASVRTVISNCVSDQTNLTFQIIIAQSEQFSVVY